jgi:hypothetical protein
VRLADLLAGLSRLADVGFGLPMGAALRSYATYGMPGDGVWPVSAALAGRHEP